MKNIRYHSERSCVDEINVSDFRSVVRSLCFSVCGCQITHFGLLLMSGKMWTRIVLKLTMLWRHP